MYRVAMAVFTPLIRTWGRLGVTGLDAMPAEGPVLLVGNHDAYWDPVIVGIAAIGRRQVRALAKDSLWNVKGLGPVLDGMGQIPIMRGAGDTGALARAEEELRAGACIGIFPEGTRSRGRQLRARSGVGRLAALVPEAAIVCVAVTGSTDVTRFPLRPRLSAHFFRPEGGPLRPGEDPADFSARLLAETRAIAPIALSGRRRRVAPMPASTPGR
jgi:1-acyl-sn-glycerol-3-phosphate acyltransferase